VERRRCLGNRLASPTGEALAHVLDHAPARRHLFQSLGDILAELAEGDPAAARTGFWAGMHDLLPSQVIGQGPSGGATTIEGVDRDGIRGSDLGRGFLQILQLQFELLDPSATLRRDPEPLTSEQRDLKLQAFDLDVERKTGRSARLLGREPRLPLGPDHCMGGGKVGRKRLRSDLHLAREA
jgi:hypothetical protein